MSALKGERGPWRNYAAEKPVSEGAFEWRLPSLGVKGAFVIFHAHMRLRGAGYTSVMSPIFDHWDGYQVTVPKGTQWREAEPSVQCSPYDCAGLRIEGLEFTPCIYCGKTPTLKAVQLSATGGTYVGSQPNRYNSWWLKCCQWGATPHLSDPREIERIRRAALARCRGGAA